MLHVIIRWNVFSKKYCKTTNELTSISTKRRNVTRNLKLVIWKCDVQFSLRNDSRIEISYDMISAMIIQFKFLPRIILRFVKLMFSHTVDVPRQVLELHSASSSLKQWKILSWQQDNLRYFNKLPAKAEFPRLFRRNFLYLDITPVVWCY